MTTDSATTTTHFDSTRAVWLGIAFSLGFTLLIWFAGEYWQDPNRYDTFSERKEAFLLPQIWYLWQLGEPTIWTRASAWLGYAAHNIVIWYLIWKAQSSDLKYTSTLHRVNVLALLANAFFICLHLLQTLVWYDGLAQDTPEFTSQASVTLVLVAILIIENQRRGMVFSYKAPFLTNIGRTVRKYHGYYFAWAIIYTFWYHPMEITGGHLVGFIYMFLLLLQGSLFFTRMHVNKYWTVVSEIAVVVHAITVAILAGQEWQQFFGGFVGMFVVTQMHGLGLSKRVRWVLGLTYAGIVLLIYSMGAGIAKAYTVTLIPAVEFLLVLLVSLIVLLLMWGTRLLRPAKAA
jgi:hypothetical protein